MTHAGKTPYVTLNAVSISRSGAENATI